jgi:chemotaxis protein MotB
MEPDDFIPASGLLEEEPQQSGWILTYADLVTLLLVFFVLMFSISTTNLEKFAEVVKSIRNNLGNSRPGIEAEGAVEGAFRGEDPELQTIVAELEAMIRENGQEERIRVESGDGEIRIRMQGAVLFKSGHAELQREALPFLDDIAKIINRYPAYGVNIKGHTDDVPISTERFPSNWELSAVRATTVLRYLIRRGVDSARLTATGYGDYVPLVPNDTPENRAINRRVEFVLEKRERKG